MMKAGFIDEVRELLGDAYEISVINVPKDNGIILEGISIKKDGANVCPTIYPQDEMTAEDVVKIYRNSESGAYRLSNILDQDRVVSKGYILKNVVPTLINRDANMNRLTELVHEPYADLEIVFRVPVNINADGEASFALKIDIAEHLGITKEEIYKAAMSNILGQGVVRSMYSILKNCSAPLPEDAADDIPMKVITNKSGIRGASVVLDKEVTDQLSETLGDFYLIPSSVHEMIAIPKDDLSDLSYLVNMVHDVNATVISREDYLSDNVYIFTNGRLEVA